MFMITTPRKTVFVYEHMSIYVAVGQWNLNFLKTSKYDCHLTLVKYRVYDLENISPM